MKRLCTALAMSALLLGSAGCSGSGASAVAFHWSGHTLAVDPGAPFCGVGMGLTLDGVKLPQTMEDDRTLDAALEAAL